MAAFFGRVRPPSVKTDKDGFAVVAVIVLESEGGNPHELFEQVRGMVGKRVRVGITYEQTDMSAKIDQVTGELLNDGTEKAEGPEEPEEPHEA
ncbi:MAG: hypothetical protein WC683_04465 [bacterium]